MTLVLQRRLPVPVEEVWSALTESAQLGRWFGTYPGIGRPGGTVEFTVTGEVDAGGEVADPETVRIVECDPPTRLAVEMGGARDPWPLTVDLATDGAGTVLRFTHRLAAGLDPADTESGWQWYLDRLVAALLDDPMPTWEDGYRPSGS